MEFSEIKKKIKEKYGRIDKKSGPLFLLSVFFEEAGELAEVVRRKERDKIEEELADCLFMIISLANYFEVDIEKRLIEKYIQNNPSDRWDLPS